MEKNLVEIFFNTVTSFPENTAIVHNGASKTYRELAIGVESTAQYLLKKDIKEGDKVLVFVPMSIQLYETVLALFSIGAVVVFVDEWSDRSRLKKALQVVDIQAIIAPPKFIWLAYILPPFYTIKKKLSIKKNITKGSFDFITVDRNKTALITFTTGSTGLPKAANRTHHFLYEQFRILKEEIAAQPTDQCLVTLPIVLLSILGTGATGFIADFNQKKPQKLDAAKQVNDLKKVNISMLIASPFFVEKLCETKAISESKIRRLMTGGAPVFPNTASKIISALPNSECIVAYGSTEAEPISTVDMKDLIREKKMDKNGLYVGRIHNEIQLKLIKMTEEIIELGDNKWADWEVEKNEIGEVVVTGPHVLDSYYNSEEAFKLNKIKDGNVVWHRTGDSGKYIEGKLYLNGRCSQLIKRGDQYISSFVMEYLINSIEGIPIGTLLENEGKLYLIIETSMNRPTAIKKATENMIVFDELIIEPSIPRDPRHFSKIDYKKLREKVFTQ